MRQRATNPDQPTRGGLSLLVAATALVFLLLAAGSPLQGQPYAGILGGFGGTFPASFVNGGTLTTEDSLNSFHIWSSTIVFDPATRFIEGEGRFSMALGTSAGGAAEIIQGRWVATKLRGWLELARCETSALCLSGGPFGVEFPPSFTAGRMRARIVLFDESGNKLGPAELTIWCSLPGIPFGVDSRDPMGRGIEQYSIKFKGLRFIVGRSGTVFVNLAG